MDSQDKKFERVNQKRRTRIELLRAARTLIEQGKNPSVADVANFASISKATAYRYFSTPEEMIREAVLDGVADRISVPPVDVKKGPADAEPRLDDLVAAVFKMVTDNEAVFRALLGASSLGQSEVRRGGRRLGWLGDALEPIKPVLDEKRFKRLVNALALVTGIESLVVMKDICQLDETEAEEVLRWTAKALLAGSQAEDLRDGAALEPVHGKKHSLC